MKVELSDRAHREMQRINVSWRKQADLPELFLDELLETAELIETTGVLGTPYNVKTKAPRDSSAAGEERIPRLPRAKIG